MKQLVLSILLGGVVLFGLWGYSQAETAAPSTLPTINLGSELTEKYLDDFPITGTCGNLANKDDGGVIGGDTGGVIGGDTGGDDTNDPGGDGDTNSPDKSANDAAPNPDFLMKIGGLWFPIRCHKKEGSEVMEYSISNFTDDELKKISSTNGKVQVGIYKTITENEGEQLGDPKEFTLSIYGTVKVRYEDTEGNQIIKDGKPVSEEIIAGNKIVGSDYQASPIAIPGYLPPKRKEGSAPDAGGVKVGEQVVVFVYEKEPKILTGSVRVLHKTDADELLEEKAHEGNIGSGYSFVKLESDKYEFVRMGENSASAEGTYQKNEQVVIFIYKERKQPNPEPNPEPNPQEPKQLTFQSKKIRVRRHSNQPGIPVETEVDGKNIKIDPKELPEGLEFDPATKTIKGKVNGKKDTYVVNVTIRDNDGNEAKGTITIEVESEPSSSSRGGGGGVVLPRPEVQPEKKPESAPEKPEEPKTPETTSTSSDMRDPLAYRIPETQSETPKKEEPRLEPQPEIVPISVEENTKIKKYVKVLPKTGVLSAGDLQKKVGIRRNAKVETNLPKEEIFRLAGSTETNLSHWLQVLPKQDQKADQYIVLPKQGLVMPVNTVAENSKAYNNFIHGRTENFSSQLHNGAVQLPGTSLGNYGQVGNKVIAGHSSYWKHSAARYKTHFQKIIGMEKGEQIWIYQKTANGDYQRFVYSVDASYNTADASYNTADIDISVIKPTANDQLTLMTCTPIGGVAGRWIVKSTFVGH